MDSLVQSIISFFVSCQLSHKTAKTFSAPLQPVKLPEGPWQKVAIDIVGSFKLGTWDCRDAITLINYYSKWCEVELISSVTTEFITAFLCSIFS